MRVQQSHAISDQLTLPANAGYNKMRIDPADPELMRDYGSSSRSPHSSKAKVYTSEKKKNRKRTKIYQTLFVLPQAVVFTFKLMWELVSLVSLVYIMLNSSDKLYFKKIIFNKKRDLRK